MTQWKRHITVFEHESLRTDRGEERLDPAQLKTLQAFFGESGVPYFSLIHNGVKFNEHVGVIQVGNTTIEVLPKADKNNNKDEWRAVLIGMLRAVGIFNIKAPTETSLRLKSNSILDLYFELFVKEVEYLVHRGLVKKYRKKEGNNTALKGAIQFAQHISQNLVHQERFYIRYTNYDKNHLIHSILYQALDLLTRLNTNPGLTSRIGALLIDFPEVNRVNISKSTFDRIHLNRKTQSYQNALDIARLILLNFHPDVSRGANHVLALMFDMNALWERFVYVSLRKYKSADTTITAQTSKDFWQSDTGQKVRIRPDIVLNKGREDCVVLDTKWKNLGGKNPSVEDLRQMYVYGEYFGANTLILVYSNSESSSQLGLYNETTIESGEEKKLGILNVAIENSSRLLQESVYNQFVDLVSKRI